MILDRAFPVQHSQKSHTSFPDCLVKSRCVRIEVVREDVAVGVKRRDRRGVTEHCLHGLEFAEFNVVTRGFPTLLALCSGGLMAEGIVMVVIADVCELGGVPVPVAVVVDSGTAVVGRWRSGRQEPQVGEAVGVLAADGCGDVAVGMTLLAA